MRRKVLWVMSVLVLCALAGCSPVQGTGMEDAPYQLTIAQLKANPEQYDMQWVEFDAYLYCMQAEEGRMATLLQEHAEEDTANRDKIKISVIEGYEGYEGMKKLGEEALQEGKTIKVRAKGIFKLNPFDLEGEVAARSQFLSHQTLERIE